MSYQEERLQEIADAIREVKGTTDKIPATNFASEIVGLSVVKPSGIITIKENGSHNVANYEWAEVNVEPALREKDIIGKWGADVNIDDSWVFEFLIDKTFKLNAGMTTITGTYVISGTQIIMTANNDTMTVQYDSENDTIDMSGDILFRMPTVSATLITKEITENGTYKASDDGADGYSEIVVNVSGGATPFADATPEEIQQIGNEISAKGMTSAEVEETYGWKIGDTKDITLTTGEVIQVRIIGINHDDLTGGGKAGITLEMANCLQTVYTLNNSNTNRGGWGATVFRNTTLPTIKATLPQEWQNIIKLVNKKSSDKNGINTVADDLFILSEIEVKGTITYAYNGQDEGSQYSYYLNGGSVIKDKAYWLRSIYNNDASFCFVRGDSGSVNYQGAWNYNYGLGISFAFCVGSSPAPVIAGLPIEATTDQEMTNALVEDNLGKVYKFTGTSDTYDNNAIYIIEEI